MDLGWRIEAERRAEALIVRAGIRHPPVPIDEVARLAGIQSITVADISNDALLVRVGSILGVTLNHNHSEVRRRFSLAHEVGHLVLGVNGHEGVLAGRGRVYNDAERTVNFFAGCLLMPRAWVISATREPTTAAEVARAFRVSVHATRIRLEQLGLHELARL